MRPFLCVLLLTGSLQSSASGEEKFEGPVRLLYSAKGLSAGELAGVLEKHYDGVNTLKFVVEKQTNVISIRAANQAALDDVLKTLATLDRTPRSIAFQGLVIDAIPPADGTAAAEFDRAQLTGSAEAVLKVARGWIREGKARVRIFHWTGLENLVSEATVGEIAPRVTGVTVTTRGQFPNYSDASVGTLFSVKPRITEASEIVVDLIYNHSEIDAKGAPEARADGGFVPTRILQGRAQTSVNIPSGRSVVIAARDGEAAGPASLVVLSATLANPNTAPVSATASTPPAVEQPAPRVATRDEPRQVVAGLPPTTFNSSSVLSHYKSADFLKKIMLTDEQKAKLDEQSLERDKLTDELRDRMGARRGAGDADELNRRREEVSTASAKRRGIDERAMAVLTNEQKTAFEAFADEARQSALAAFRNSRNANVPDEVMSDPGPGGRLPAINRMVERSPNDPRLLLQRAQAYAAEEKWDEAIADYRRVVELDPKSWSGFSELATVLAFCGDEPGFRQLADQMLERFHDEPNAEKKLRIATACLLRPEWLSNPTVAESFLDASIKAIPEGGPGRAGRIDLAAAVALPPNVPAEFALIASTTTYDILFARCHLHVLRGQADEAIKLLKPLSDDDATTGRSMRGDLKVSCFAVLAIAHLSKGTKDAAQAALNRAREPQTQTARVRSSSIPLLELASKVRLQRAEEILRDAGGSRRLRSDP